MAKKTAKKSTKKTKAPTQTEIRRVFGECAFAIGQGVEAQAAASGCRFTLASDAVRYWADRYWTTVPKGMKKAPWRAAKKLVLVQARQLGVEAAKAALAAAAQGATEVVVSAADVKAASAIVEHDQACAAAAVKGAGVYCEAQSSVPAP
jgi:hypothetical protein